MKILFRGKRVDTGEWVTGFYVCLNGGKHLIYTGYAEIDCGEFFPDRIKVISKSIGQYIGRTDENNKMIFKGDLVTYAEDGIRGDFSQGVVEIIWDEKTAGFCGKTKQGRLVGIDHLKNIVGNIYDNPELLEVK